VSGPTLTRALDLYRRTATTRSAIILIVANAIPLAGVLFFGWSLWTILVLYWLENGIVGFWNVPKIILAQGAATASGDPGAQRLGGPGGVGRAALAAFFCVHYGMFWFVHGVFIFTLPLFLGGGGSCGVLPGVPGPFGPGPEFTQACGNAFGAINWTSVWIGGVALFVSHGASFLLNYIGRGEYLTATAGGQMAAPYARVVILHLTIIFGAFVVAFLGSPIGALVVLVGLKTAFDLGLHLRERRRAESAWHAADGSAVEPGHVE
jgi:Family of unknown function (DUF6498)